MLILVRAAKGNIRQCLNTLTHWFLRVMKMFVAELEEHFSSACCVKSFLIRSQFCLTWGGNSWEG